MTLERTFQDQVVQVATMFGWEWAHFRPAKTAHGWRTAVSGTIGKGWPDLTLVRAKDRRLIFAELKSDDGDETAAQSNVLAVLRRLEQRLARVEDIWGEVHFPTRVEVFTWRPQDLDDIAKVLR